MPFKLASKLRFPPRLVVSVQGIPKSGKTHQLFGCPRPLYIFNVDQGLEGMMEEEEKFDLSRVFVADYALSKPAALTKSDASSRALTVVNAFLADFRQKLQREKRCTLALDTASEFWELFRMGDFGKLEQVPPLRYTKVNRIWRGIMNEVYQTPHNLLLVHRMKQSYESKVVGGKEVSTPIPGQFEVQGHKETDGIVQVSIETFRKERKKDGKKGKKGSVYFGFTVAGCRQRASLIGTKFVGERATFTDLACAVFPKSSPEDWV